MNVTKISVERPTLSFADMRIMENTMNIDLRENCKKKSKWIIWLLDKRTIIYLDIPTAEWSNVELQREMHVPANFASRAAT